MTPYFYVSMGILAFVLAMLIMIDEAKPRDMSDYLTIVAVILLWPIMVLAALGIIIFYGLYYYLNTEDLTE